MTSIRLAFVVNSFAMGGLERSIARLANGVDREHFDPTVICLCNDTSAANWLQGKTTPVLTLNKKLGNDHAVVRRLAVVLNKLSVDVVHSHNWGTILETSLARYMAHVPVHVHAERGTVGGSIDGTGFRNRIRSCAMRWCMNRADAVVSNAISVCKRVEARCGYPAERIHVISNGVESLQLADHELARQEIRRELGIPSGASLIGSVGRLQKVKAFELAIDALAAMHTAPDPHLVLVGDGDQLQFLQQRAATLGVTERVHFAGRQEDGGRWLAAMDVYVNTSLSEGMSQSIVEAMSVGLPLVVTDVGDNALLALGEPVCGLVIDSGSVPQMASALNQLIGDPLLRQELGTNALTNFQARFEFKRMVDDYQLLYDELIRQKRLQPCR